MRNCRNGTTVSKVISLPGGGGGGGGGGQQRCRSSCAFAHCLLFTFMNVSYLNLLQTKFNFLAS